MMTFPARPWQSRTHFAPLDHAVKASMLQAARLQRLTSVATAATQLFASPAYSTAWEECWNIGDAARRRLERLQGGWVHNWFTWLEYCSQIEGAGTVSKFSEREVNIVNQALQLVSEQSVDVLTLVENLEIDVLYWLSRRPPPPPPPGPTEPDVESITAMRAVTA